MIKTIILTVLFITILGCQKNKKLVIVPMITRINKEKGNDVQFFEIDNYSDYPPSNLIDSILAFSEKELTKNNQMPPKVRIQYFYKETLFGACGDELIYLDSDFYEEGIPKRMDQRVALIWLISQDDKKNDSIFNREIIYWTDKGKYVKDYRLQSDGTRFPDFYSKIYFTRRDSVLIKGTTWKILKKGRIEKS
jgi:hypothetical protein